MVQFGVVYLYVVSNCETCDSASAANISANYTVQKLANMGNMSEPET